MESIRRCEDCRRVVHGAAGNACPYCGGARLNRMVEQRVSGVRLHPPVFKLALTFCFGLAIMQLAALAVGIHGPPGRAAPLWQLNLLIAVSVAVYVPLRQAEGDFCALFIAALAIFVCGEGLSALSRAYGIGSLRALTSVFRHALLVISSLGLTAAAADMPLQTRHERTMLAACAGFLFLAMLCILMEYFRTENDSLDDAATALVTFSTAVYAGIVLYFEKKESDQGSVPASHHSDALLTPEKEPPKS